MAVISELKARNLKLSDGPIAHGGVTGLTLHPSSVKGQGKWVFRYVSPATGKRRNAGVGSYPEIGIAEAGKRALAMREQLAVGDDPLQIKAQAAAKAHIRPPTFEEAARILHEELCPGWKNPKHAQQWINTLEQYAFPEIGQMTLDQIQPAHIANVLRPIWICKAETASRIKQRLHAVIAWGWAHGYCTSNPADVVHHLLPQQPGKAIRVQHQPAMPWRDIPKFVAEHLGRRARHDQSRAMLELLILTACRSGELRGMTWDEIDFDKAIWTIPAARMKAKMPHRVPLAPRALEILRGQDGYHPSLVFPAPYAEGPLSDMVLTSFLRRVNAPSDVPERCATAHGFRSSFRDWCSEQGYPRDLAERALAHTVANMTCSPPAVPR